MSQELGGVWPAMLTPLDQDHRVAPRIVERLADLLVNERLDGLYVTGSTGQWPLLTLDERRAVVEHTLQAVAGRVPVMVHVGAAATSDAIALAQHAQRSGAAAVSAVTPIYYSHSVDAVLEYYRAIGSATDLPLYAYHLSGVSQMSIDPRRYAERLLTVPNLAGLKFTDHNLYALGQIQQASGGRLRLFSGADELLCQAVLCGTVGAIGTFFNLWGKACQQARHAMVQGEVTPARDFMLTFQLALAEIIASGSIWTFLRAAMRQKYDLDVGLPRPPLGAVDKPWNDSDVQRIVRQVEKG